MLFHALWVSQTVVNNSIGFFAYQLVHGMESILPVECEIPLLKLAIYFLVDTSKLEEHLIHLDHLDEQCQDVIVVLEINKCHVKDQYDKFVHPRPYSEGDLVLLYDQASEPLG